MTDSSLEGMHYEHTLLPFFLVVSTPSWHVQKAAETWLHKMKCGLCEQLYALPTAQCNK